MSSVLSFINALINYLILLIVHDFAHEWIEFYFWELLCENLRYIKSRMLYYLS